MRKEGWNLDRLTRNCHVSITALHLSTIVLMPPACTGDGNLMNVELFSNLLSRLAARHRRVSHVVPDVSCSIGTTGFVCMDPAACSALALLSGVGIESISAPLAT